MRYCVNNFRKEVSAVYSGKVWFGLFDVWWQQWRSAFLHFSPLPPTAEEGKIPLLRWVGGGSWLPPPSPTAEEGKIPLLRWVGGGNCFCNGIWGWDQVYGQPDLKNTVFFYDFPYLGKVSQQQNSGKVWWFAKPPSTPPLPLHLPKIAIYALYYNIH